MQERHMSARRGRPNGSVGNKQVAAALQGMNLPCIPTLHTSPSCTLRKLEQYSSTCIPIDDPQRLRMEDRLRLR